jgi:hypothetical protein
VPERHHDAVLSALRTCFEIRSGSCKTSEAWCKIGILKSWDKCER